MQKRTREILALALLVVLGLGIAGVMSWYLLVGHSWNKAASSIDDWAGSMEGYTIVLYDSPKAEGKAPSAQGAAERRRSVDAATAASVYRRKGAATVIVDISDPGRYADPVIVSKGGKRIAIADMAGRSSAAEARRFVAEMAGRQVDTVIGVTSDRAAPVRRYEGVDLMLYAFDGTLPDGGIYHGETFCVDMSAEGKVQAVVIAPSGVMTAKNVQKG